MKYFYHRNAIGFLALLFMIAFSTAGAKIRYDVFLSADNPYEELSGASELQFLPDQDGYYFFSDFMFPVFERQADFNLRPEIPSAGAYISPDGYLAIYENPGFANTIIFQVFGNSDFTTVEGITTLSAKWEGVYPQRMLKIQFKDVVLKNDEAQKINYQIWFSEEDSTFSYHFGPNTLTDKNIPGNCGVMTANPTFSAVLDGIVIWNNDDQIYKYEDFTDFNLPTLTLFPDQGYVVIFTPQTASSVEEEMTNNIKVYPNPCKDRLLIETDTAGFAIDIYDVAGNRLLQSHMPQAIGEADLSSLAPGAYSLIITTGKGEKVLKTIVKE